MMRKSLKTGKALVPVLIWIVGIILAIYIGFWLMFICGIVQIVEAVKADPVSSWGIAWGIVRVILASFVGWLIFWLTSIVALFFCSR